MKYVIILIIFSPFFISGQATNPNKGFEKIATKILKSNEAFEYKTALKAYYLHKQASVELIKRGAILKLSKEQKEKELKDYHFILNELSDNLSIKKKLITSDINEIYSDDISEEDLFRIWESVNKSIYSSIVMND